MCFTKNIHHPKIIARDPPKKGPGFGFLIRPESQQGNDLDGAKGKCVNWRLQNGCDGDFAQTDKKTGGQKHAGGSLPDVCVGQKRKMDALRTAAHVSGNPFSSSTPPAAKPKQLPPVPPTSWRESRRLVSVSLLLSPLFLVPKRTLICLSLRIRSLVAHYFFFFI